MLDDGHLIETNLSCAHLPYDTSVERSLQWRHNGRDGVSNHQPPSCLLNHILRPRSKKTSKLRVTGLCAGISPVTGEFPAQMAINTENVSIWWRHPVLTDGIVKSPAWKECTWIWPLTIQGHHRIRSCKYNIKSIPYIFFILLQYLSLLKFVET